MSLSREGLLNEFAYGFFEEGRLQPALLTQLRADLSAIKSVNGCGGGKSATKPGSKPPADLSCLDLLTKCEAEVARVADDKEAPLVKLENLRGKVRTVLGYGVGTMTLPAVVCHQCGGRLKVARDASSAVECSDCDTNYPTASWIDLLAAKETD